MEPPRALGHAPESSTEEAPPPPLRVLGWTGVLVRSKPQVPLYVPLAKVEHEGPWEVQVGGVACKCVLRDMLLAAVVPLEDLPAGEHALRVLSGGEPLVLLQPGGAESGTVRVLVAEPEGLDSEGIAQESARLQDLWLDAAPMPDWQGNSLAALELAEEHHQRVQHINAASDIAVLITKTHAEDWATVFVFSLRGGKARLDRYETVETNLREEAKWEFVDCCTLDQGVGIATSGACTVIKLGPTVEFVFEPRASRGGSYNVNLTIGPMVFAAITSVGEEWIEWFSKKWIMRVSLGDTLESGLADRFAAPTMASLSKRAASDKRPKPKIAGRKIF